MTGKLVSFRTFAFFEIQELDEKPAIIRIASWSNHREQRHHKCFGGGTYPAT